MRGLRFVTASMLLIGGTAVQSKKPESRPFQPEVGYTVRYMDAMELRLASESGREYVPMYRGPLNALGHFDLSPRSKRQIAFAENGVLKLLTYMEVLTFPVEGDVFSVDTKTIYSGPGTVVTMDFSPDGSKIAFYVDTPNRIMVHDVATGTNSTLAAAGPAGSIAWYHDGSGLVFHAPVPDSGWSGVYELSAAGGAPVLLHQEPLIEDLDTARTDKTLLITYTRPGKAFGGLRVVGAWRDGAYIKESLVVGSSTHFNCDDRKMIFRGFHRSGRYTIVRIAWKERSIYRQTSTYRDFLPENIQQTDWIPTCAE